MYVRWTPTRRSSYLHSFASRPSFGRTHSASRWIASSASGARPAIIWKLVQHLREHVEPDFDAGLLGSLGEHPAVIDKGLVASGLQEDWRESRKVAVERACMRIARV